MADEPKPPADEPTPGAAINAPEPVHASDRVSELYAWVAIHKNGGETIITTTITIPGRPALREQPLITQSKRSAIQLGGAAQASIDAAQKAGQDFVRTEMRTFTVVR